MTSAGGVTGDIQPGSPTEKNLARAVVGVALVVLLFVAVVLEFTLVFPAVTALARAFRTTEVAWSLSIVTLVGAAICPLGGKLGDRFGKKTVIVGVIVCAAAGSLLCAIASSYAFFLVGRGLQGTGVVLLPLVYGYVRDVLPPRLMAVGLGATVVGNGVAAIAGPFLSAWLLGTWGYRGIFWFLLCYMALLGALFTLIAPKSTVRQRRRLDAVSGVLLGAGVGVVLLGMGRGSSWGWASALTLGSFVAGVVLIGGSIARMLTIVEPLVDLRYLAGPRLRTTILYLFFGSLPVSGLAFILPLMVETRDQAGIHYGLSATPLHYAILSLPAAIVITTFGPVGGLLARARNPRLVARMSAITLVVAMLLLGFWHTQDWHIWVFDAVYGIGNALFFAAYANLVAQAVPPEEMATTSGVTNLINSLAFSISPLLAGMILAQSALRIDPVTRSPVYADGGYFATWMFLAAASFAALVVAMVMRHGKEPATGHSETKPEQTEKTALHA